MNYETLKQLVLAVEDNKRVNQGDWKGWDAGDIFEVYGASVDYDVMRVLERAIASNGKSLPEDLRAAEFAEFGMHFGGTGVLDKRLGFPGNVAGRDPYWIDMIEAAYSDVETADWTC